MTDQAKILTSIRYGRDVQDAKWGDLESRLDYMNDDRWIRVLVEEVGEAAAEVQNEDDEKLMAELTQVATVAVAHIESILLRRRKHSLKTRGKKPRPCTGRCPPNLEGMMTSCTCEELGLHGD
jgi:NTP pyrophosphatase (non-canonical NTP hydrolase)